MTLDQIIQKARELDCSDIHLTKDQKPVVRKDGKIIIDHPEFPQILSQKLINSILSEEQKQKLKKQDIDLAFEDTKGRCRINIYKQKGELCAAIRLLKQSIPTLEELNLPRAIKTLAQEPRGLVLITGPTGSGKSTTLAAMLKYINTTRNAHIITAEDPIEYRHEHINSIIHQREIGLDVDSFSDALRSSLREDPDVIMVGEMRDLETISAAITAAETGHLVLSTLHTIGAKDTVDRIIDAFPQGSQAQIRTQLSAVLKGVVTQQLLPKASQEGRIAAHEILLITDSVKNLIRENKNHQLYSVMQTSAKDGMMTLNMNLADKVKKGEIDFAKALEISSEKQELMTLIST